MGDDRSVDGHLAPPARGTSYHRAGTTCRTLRGNAVELVDLIEQAQAGAAA